MPVCFLFHCRHTQFWGKWELEYRERDWDEKVWRMSGQIYSKKHQCDISGRHWKHQFSLNFFVPDLKGKYDSKVSCGIFRLKFHMKQKNYHVISWQCLNSQSDLQFDIEKLFEFKFSAVHEIEVVWGSMHVEEEGMSRCTVIYTTIVYSKPAQQDKFWRERGQEKRMKNQLKALQTQSFIVSYYLL